MLNVMLKWLALSKGTNQLDETLKPLHLGDYSNFVGKNKKVHDFSLKLGVTHWGFQGMTFSLQVLPNK